MTDQNQTMSDLIFLKALRDKLKGGNSRSIHLNALPGRLVTRLDLAGLDEIETGLARQFLDTLLTKAVFEFKLSFDAFDLNTISDEQQKRLGQLSKRLNSICNENEDNFKEHGIKTFGFGYPLLIKRSKTDNTKLIKAPLFIWPLEIVKSPNKVNSWSLLRNKIKNEQGKIVDEEVHSVGLNEVLLSFIKNDDGITIPQINEELLEDMIIDPDELLGECVTVLRALNAYSENTRQSLEEKFRSAISRLPDAKEFDAISNNSAWICMGGVFGLFRSQKESIISDIDRLIERMSEFSFDDLVIEPFGGSPFSAVKTDPTQQEILTTLGTEPRKIIQGPPGTGKSQSLTALITNAIANGKKCLVVCEKKTALSVIKENLTRENEQIGALAAVIEDISKDRDAIVGSVRDRLQTIEQFSSFGDTAYTHATLVAEKLAAEINEQHSCLDEDLYQGKRWTDLVGEYLRRQKHVDPEAIGGKIAQEWFSFNADSNELAETAAVLREAKKLYSEVGTLEHPLDQLHDDVFGQRNYHAVKTFLQDKLAGFASQASKLCEDMLQLSGKHSQWLSECFHQYPAHVKISVESFVPLMLGNNCADYPEQPDKQALEEVLSRGKEQLLASKNDIQQLIRDYETELQTHYQAYHDSLVGLTESYQSFSEYNVTKYGPFFLKNDGFSRLLTNGLGIVFRKYKAIKVGREEMVLRLSAIRHAHAKEEYIVHEYPQTDIKHFSILVDNVKSLSKAVVLWHKETPGYIRSYLANVSVHNLHPVFKGKEKQITTTIQAFHQQQEEIVNVIGTSSRYTTELNSICERIEELQREIQHNAAKITEIRETYAQLRIDNLALFGKLKELVGELNSISLFKEEKQQDNTLKKSSESVANIRVRSTMLLEYLRDFRGYFDWRLFVKNLTEAEYRTIGVMVENGIEEWDIAFECWYLNWLLAAKEHNHLPKNDDKIMDFIRAGAELKDKQVKSIVYNWQKRQYQSIRELTRSGINPISLFNKKGKKGERRNSLRKIIKSEFELFTDFYPVLMVSPTVCSSLLPLTEGLFDIVIFDEASQLRIEDTYPALLRGKIRIVSGDSQQMPPSNYFLGARAVLDPSEEDMEDDEETVESFRKADTAINLADSESLLEYAEKKGYKPSYLKIHYRSQHPALIEFSNSAFYGRRLVPMPAKHAYCPIHFIEVNGLYEDQMNRDEAKQVVSILLNHIKPLSNGKYPSVGIATFNIYQRELILEEIIKARQLNPAHNKKIADLGEDLFVKNLENIQGDERDIIILSTTYGRRADSSFRQSFGSISQGIGYKLLNVIITRAKFRLFVCTSVPAEYYNKYPVFLQEMRNNGRAVFYAYLAYAKAISNRDTPTARSILDQLYENCESTKFDIEYDAPGSESPFEDEVYYRLAEHIGQERIVQQYRVGGFRIDMVVLSKITNQPVIALECDGAAFHSSTEAYAWDVFRQQQIEQFGFTFVRIWSTNWWYNPIKELKKMVSFIYDYDHNEKAKQEAVVDSVFDDVLVEPVTQHADLSKLVGIHSLVTVKTLQNETLTLRFSSNEHNDKKKDAAGVITVYHRSPIAIALMGRTEVDICQLGTLEVYYRIEKVINE